MQEGSKIKVGILRGGVGEEYADSIEIGGELLRFIEEHLNEKYKTVDILIDRNGVWHIHGLPIDPLDLVHRVDLVWNVTHPSFSNALNSIAIPNIGHDAFLQTLEKNHDLLKEHASRAGIQIPKSYVLPPYREDLDGSRTDYGIRKAKEVHAKFGAPWLVKSFNRDPDMGIHVAKTFGELVSAIDDGVNHGDSILVQEFITGRDASVYSVPHFRNEPLYTFPLVHETNESIKFSNSEREKILSIARNLHNVLGAKHYLKSNLIITPSGRVYLASIESDPDLRKDSHFHKVCEAVGAKAHQVIDHILSAVLK